MGSISAWIKNKKKICGELVKKTQCIECLLKELEIKAENFHFADTDNTFQLRRTLDVHLPIKREHFWERLITSVMPENTFYNQFSFNGTNNIDLVKTTEQREICNLIELKTGSNEISHACYEIVFYYLLLLRAKDKGIINNKDYKLSDKISLTVLLPEYYRKAKYQHKFFNKFQDIVAKRYNVAIKFIPLPNSDDNDSQISDMTENLCNNILIGKITNIPQNLRDYFLRNL